MRHHVSKQLVGGFCILDAKRMRNIKSDQLTTA
jgi:hypothetical protein